MLKLTSYEEEFLNRNEKKRKHNIRVGLICELLARKVGLSEKMCEHCREGGILHDIGKRELMILVNKKGPLTAEERKKMNEHPTRGAEILQNKVSEEVLEIVKHHHESYDGTGYPDNLVGEEIPIGARVVKVADVFDALRSKRAYKETYDLEKTLNIMKQGDSMLKATELDPEILKVFFANISEINELYERYL